MKYLYEWLGEFQNNEERKKIVSALIKYRCMSLYSTDEVNHDDSEYQDSAEGHNINLFKQKNLFETEVRPVRENGDLEHIRRDLEEVGYCRLRGLSSPQYKKDRDDIYRQMVCDFASKMGVEPEGFTRLRPEQFIDISQRAGIIHYANKMYHSNSMWMVRGHPALVETMAAIYNCPPEHMCVSYDTMGIRYAPEFVKHCIENMDTEVSGEDFDKYMELLSMDELFPHVDQRFEYEFQENYQGIYAFTSTPTEEDGGIAFYPSTHLLHGRALQVVLDTDKYQDFIPYPRLFNEMFPDSQPVHIPVSAGEYVIWDSRLVHSNMCINPARFSFDRITWDDSSSTMFDWWQLHRIVGYICFHPDEVYSKVWTTMNDIKKSMSNIYRFGWATNHSCNHPRVIEIESDVPDRWQSLYHRMLVNVVEPKSIRGVDNSEKVEKCDSPISDNGTMTENMKTTLDKISESCSIL